MGQQSAESCPAKLSYRKGRTQFRSRTHNVKFKWWVIPLRLSLCWLTHYNLDTFAEGYIVAWNGNTLELPRAEYQAQNKRLVWWTRATCVSIRPKNGEAYRIRILPRLTKLNAGMLQTKCERLNMECNYWDGCNIGFLSSRKRLSIAKGTRAILFPDALRIYYSQHDVTQEELEEPWGTCVQLTQEIIIIIWRRQTLRCNIIGPCNCPLFRYPCRILRGFQAHVYNNS